MVERNKYLQGCLHGGSCLGQRFRCLLEGQGLEMLAQARLWYLYGPGLVCLHGAKFEVLALNTALDACMGKALSACLGKV